MWALRRAAGPLRTHKRYGFITTAVCSDSVAVPYDAKNVDQCQKNNCIGPHHLNGRSRQDNGNFHKTYEINLHNKGFVNLYLSKLPLPSSTTSSLQQRNFSSKSHAKFSSKESDIENEFSDLGELVEADGTVREETLIARDESDEESDEEVFDAIGLLDAETGLKDGKNVKRTFVLSPLAKFLLKASKQNLPAEMDKWLKDGNRIERADIFGAFWHLRKRNLYVKALQFMEWLCQGNHIEFNERLYASQLDLIGKVSGLRKAEKFLEDIPHAFRKRDVYGSLLANCVASRNVAKSEEILNKIRELGFPLTAFICNQLLILYRRDQKKFADVLELMEKENILPSRHTYILLINIKGYAKDISGMEQVIDAMKAKGVSVDLKIQALIAKHYTMAGSKDKAEAVLKEMEGGNIAKNRRVCKFVLPLYSFLRCADDVERIWKICEPDPQLSECLAAVNAWGNLGNVGKAEEVFAFMLDTWGKLGAKYYDAMLKVYARNKQLSKGKDLVKKMTDSGIQVGDETVDAIVKLCVESGDMEKAESVLDQFRQNKYRKPQYSTYLHLLEWYANRGDIHSTERIFSMLQQSPYNARMKNYELLLLAYVKAKSPAYGFRERMKADNLVPNRTFAAQLATIDSFKRPAQISEMLD